MPFNWINKLNAENGRLHKEEVISQALAAAKIGSTDADTFLTMAWYAYNPFNTYNNKKITVIEGLTNRDNPFNDFYKLLNRLNNREVTGHSAIAEIEQMAYNFDTDVWKTLLRPVLLKDLRSGATANTFNKICKGTKYEIPMFESQLATDCKKHPNKLVGKKILEPKLDGVRMLAVIDTVLNKVNLFSRNGKELNNFPHIEEQILNSKTLFASAVFNDPKHNKWVLDGEVVSENFQALMTQVQRKGDIDTSSAVYSIFDILPLAEFLKGKWDKPQIKRTNEYLGSVRESVNAENKSLHIIKGIEVDLDTAEGHDIMERFFKAQIAMDYEGVMIKDVNAPYKCKRSFNWLKMKPSITTDLAITGFEVGTGKHKNRLGALICEGYEDGKHIKVNVGGGLSDDLRTDIWNDQEGNLGQIVEIKADVITKGKDSDTYSLRFPRFVRFRGIEAGEKM